MTSFIHLHTYSDYSLGKSSTKIQNLVDCCKKMNMPAIALTDNQNLFGSLEFAMECAKNGIQPISGIKLKINGHALILLAKSKKGFENLLLLSSDLYINKNATIIENHVTSLKLKHLLTNSEGLIALLGYQSEFGHLLNNTEDKNNESNATELLLTFKKYFHDDLFIEFHRYKNLRESQFERQAIKIAYDNNVPIVATNPVEYLSPNMHESHDALLCIANNKYIADINREYSDIDHYFKSESEMITLFHDLPEAIENTILIARKCHFMTEARKPLLPKFLETLKNEEDDIDTEDDISTSKESAINIDNENKLLRKNANFGLQKRFVEKNITDTNTHKEYIDRLNFELSVIEKMGFSGYFLIVSDFIKWSKLQNIPVGPGRGSGAGSLVAWCVEITNINPIQFDLLFERFLNPDRVSMPDFDIDFCQSRRDEVIDYVRNKYGNNRVAQIITFGKLQPRIVLRDVGRVLQMPYNLIDKLCKMVPNNPANPITLAEAIEIDKELKYMRDTDNDISKLLRISLQLEGVYRHASTHAAGIVIADRKITKLIPLYKIPESDIPIVQYNMKYAEAAGLTKFDFLGLKTLTVIQQVIDLIKSRHNITLNFSQMDFDDAKSYKMLSDGYTAGVFQFEGFGMREAMKNLKPDCINDLIALTSLYRPGPMNNISHYINRKHDLEKIESIHPKLNHLLEETYGIIIYQEQVIKIAQILAGYTLGEADLLRRAMGKKNKKEMEEQRSIFIKNAVKNNIEEAQAVGIFNLVEKFASYGFNKSHGAAYSVISYQTAYLKANYTIEFLVASINLDVDRPDKIHLFYIEAKKFNINIIKPCINTSDVYFTIYKYPYICNNDNVKDDIIDDNYNNDNDYYNNTNTTAKTKNQNAILYGLAGIKGAGLKIIENIVNDRKSNGQYTDIFTFLERTVKLGLNKRTFEALVKADVLNAIYPNSNELMNNINNLISYANKQYEANASRQISLFGLQNIKQDNMKILKKAKDWTFEEKIQSEYEALGFYLTHHPLEPYIDRLKKLNIVEATDIEIKAKKHPTLINVCGVILSNKIRSGKGGKFSFLQLSDMSGILDISIFNESMLFKHADILKVGGIIYCTVSIRKDDNGLRITIEEIHNIKNILKDIHNEYHIHIDNKIDFYTVTEILNDNVANPKDNSLAEKVSIKIIFNITNDEIIHFKFQHNIDLNILNNIKNTHKNIKIQKIN